MGDPLIEAWTKRIAVCGILLLATKGYFEFVLLPVSWMFCLIIAMSLVTFTRIAVWSIRR